MRLTLLSRIGLLVLACCLMPQLTEAEPEETDARSRILLPDSVEKAFPEALAEIRDSALRIVPNMTIEVVVETSSQIGADKRCAWFHSAEIQAYGLRTGNDAAIICTTSPEGALYGLSQLESIWLKGPVGDLQIETQPAFDRRALHFVVRHVTAQQFREIILRARLARFNTLVLMMTDGIAFRSFPGKVRKDAISPDLLSSLCDEARGNGLSIVAEVKLLTHQQVFLQDSHPELMFNKVTYDPRKSAVYDLVSAYIDEVVATVEPVAINIGHDEVKGIGVASRKRSLNSGENPLPAPLFLQDVITLRHMLVSRGLQVWMWGDMLLPKSLLPEVLQRSWDERQEYPDLLDRIPKDIVINDWHYFDERDFPSADYFDAHGFRVMGATWYDREATKAFSTYLANRKWHAAGMVATTWSLIPQGKWGQAFDLIETSGEAFWDGR